MKISIQITPEEQDYKALFKAMSDPEVIASLTKVMPTMMNEGAKAMAQISPEAREAMSEVFQDAWNRAAQNAMEQTLKQMAKSNPFLAMFARAPSGRD